MLRVKLRLPKSPQVAVCTVSDGLADMFGGESLGFGGDIVEIDIGLLR